MLIKITKFSAIKGEIFSLISTAPCVSSVSENPFAGQAANVAKVLWLVVARKSVIKIDDDDRFYYVMRNFQHIRPTFKDWFLGIEVYIYIYIYIL